MEAPQPLLVTKHKFVTLDALRGIAAIAVMLYHSNSLSAHLFRHGYLAVDFFFVLSGFVLSYAYGQRLAEGWPLLRFMRERYVRLMPLATLGLLLGFLVSLDGIFAVHAPLPLHSAIWILPLNLLFLPVYPFNPSYLLFPYDPPAWSLFYELFSNLVHALFLRRVRTGTLLALNAVSGGLLVWRIVQTHNADIGLSLLNADGFMRVLFSYSLGMLLFRLWHTGKLRWSLSPAIACLALLVVIAYSPPARFSTAYNILCIVLLLPGVVVLGISAHNNARYVHGLQMLGAASYAVYVLQSPLLGILTRISMRLTHKNLADHRPWSAILVLTVVVGAALLSEAYFDVPLRKRLRKRKAEVVVATA